MTNHNAQKSAPGLKTSLLLVAFLGVADLAVAATDEGVIDPDSMPALVRDFDLTSEQLQQRISAEQTASGTEHALRDALGDSFAGSWLIPEENGDIELVVAATDVAGVIKVQSAGAIPKLVINSLERLTATKEQLDHVSTTMTVPDSVAAWYVDARTNQVVVDIVLGNPAATQRAQTYVAQSGADNDMIRFNLVKQRPQTTANLLGGHRYNNTSTGGSCSIGFAAEKWVIMPSEQHYPGFATAGHCGDQGDSVSRNGTHVGGFLSSTFPSRDRAFVGVVTPSSWTLRPRVTNYSGGYVSVHGDQEASIGAAVCRSGYRTGYRCGTIVAKNVTVNYVQGTVFDLTQIDACVGFGDSGGAVITPSGQAQGVTSGGQIQQGQSSNCSDPTPVTYIEPQFKDGIVILYTE